MTIEELSWFVDDTVIRKLQGLKGVARVDRYGGVTREIKVELDPDRLNALGVTAGDVNRALRAANVDMTGGSGDFGEPRPVDPHARRRQDDRRPRSAGNPARRAAARCTLSDIATVTDSWEEPKSFARVNSQTVVSFGIFRGKGESDVEVNERVEAAVAELQASHPDVSITKVDNSVDLHRGQLRFGDGDAARRRGAVGHRRASVPARHRAPRWCRRWRCRCRSSRPSGRST